MKRNPLLGEYGMAMIGSFYNTTSETNPTLSEYKRINSGQDATILKCFEKYRYRKMTPFMVHSLCDLSGNVPITSIRRSITNLTDSGFLVKLDTKAPGLYNRPNHLWKLAK